MYFGRSVAVVVPAYNEEQLVGDVIETMPEFVDRVYVVDDGSTDDTWEEISTYTEDTVIARHERPSGRRAVSNGGTGSRVTAYRHEKNRGVGGAIKTGYSLALEEGIDVTAVMGGDGQMPPDELSNIVEPVARGEADYAKGNRLARPEFRSGMSAWRSFGNTVLSLLTKIASGHWQLTDSQNGYTAISRRALETIDIESMYEYYGYCNDLLVRLNANGFDVVDVPMEAVYGEEQSSIVYPEYIRNVSLLLLQTFLWRLWVKYVRRRFHLVGILCVGVGLAGLATALGDRSVIPGPSVFRGLPSAIVSKSGVVRRVVALLYAQFESSSPDTTFNE